MTLNLQTPLRIGTLNVRGLGSKRRQLAICSHLKEKQLDIVGIQETKVEREEHTGSMVDPFLPDFFVAVSHSVGFSAGCCLLLRKTLGITVQNVVSSEHGRFVLCDFVHEDVECRVLCVYTPTKAKARYNFFESIEIYVVTERVLVVIGDFNCVCLPENRSNQESVDRSAKLLAKIASDCCLEDVALIVDNGKSVPYTRFQGASDTQLDRIYVSAELVPLCNSYEGREVSFSDHYLVLVSVSLGDKTKPKHKFNWSLWKIKAKLLHDKLFLEGCRN